MDEILQKIAEQEKKIDAIYASVEKLRKYFLWTMIITIVTVVLPLLALVVIVPFVIRTILGAYSGLL